MGDWLPPSFATVYYDEEANIYVSKSMEYRIMSQSRSVKEALEALRDAVESHLKICKQEGMNPIKNRQEKHA